MDLGRAFGFVTEDDGWVSKILIGGLILLIPIIGWFALLGFVFETARNVANRVPNPLPDWSNFGDKLRMGFHGFVIAIVYLSPIIVLSLVPVCLTPLLGVAGEGGNDAAAGVFAVLILCINLLTVVGSIALQPVMLAGYARYVQTESLGAALRIGDVFGNIVRPAFGKWLVLWLVYLLCSIVGGLGAIACGIGALFTTIYGQAVFGHVLGQTVAQMGGTSGSMDMVPPEAPPPTYS